MIRTLFSSTLRLLLLPTILLPFAAVSVAQTPAVETKTEKVAVEKPLGEVDRWIKDNDGKEPLYGACLIADCGSEGNDTDEGNDKNIENGRALVLPKPQYPPAAKLVKASGTVKVQVIIDETGQVIAAQAIDGHPLLFGVSVTAARAARFSPPKYRGQAAKIIGIITYTFVTQ